MKRFLFQRDANVRRIDPGHKRYATFPLHCVFSAFYIRALVYAYLRERRPSRERILFSQRVMLCSSIASCCAFTSFLTIFYAALHCGITSLAQLLRARHARQSVPPYIVCHLIMTRRVQHAFHSHSNFPSCSDSKSKLLSLSKNP